MNIYSIVIPIFCLFWIGGIVYPNYFARNISLFPEMTGSANALFGAFVFLIAGISSGFGTLLRSTTEMPLVITYIILASVSLGIYYLDLNRKRNLQ